MPYNTGWLFQCHGIKILPESMRFAFTVWRVFVIKLLKVCEGKATLSCHNGYAV